MIIMIVIANFIVAPDDLRKVYVPQPVAIQFVDLTLVDFLGETGVQMAEAGFKFLVTQKLAQKLIKDGSAIIHPDISLKE